jgi:hypothetical protein
MRFCRSRFQPFPARKSQLLSMAALGIKDVNRYPVIHTWSYKLADAA